MKLPRTLKNNKWRYLSLAAGFFLLVAPFAFLTQLAFLLVGEEGQATLHSICYKLPLDWLISGPGDFFALGIVATSFVVIILTVAFVFGPLFCGHLCPVGAFGELVSRIAPIPDRFRMRLKDPGLTTRLRYGFLAGFVILAWMIGERTALCPYGIDLGRYCTSAIFQYFSLGLLSDQLYTSFWNTGALLTLVVWLALGGLLMVGGRGWCMFFCPLGALSGLAHRAGRALGLYRVDFNEARCKGCKKCQVNCPMWAIKEDRGVEGTLCIGCRECVNNCSFHAYQFTHGRGMK
jgi:ferredoxin-type protein NapH